MAETGTPAPERWCGGRRAAGVRPMTDAERALVIALRARERRALGRLAAGAALALTVPLAVAAATPGASGALATGLGVYAVAALLLGVPIAILATRDRLGALRDYRAALRNGEVEVFAAPGAAAPDVALLPRSRRAIAAPAPQALGRRQRVAEVAPGPTYEWRVPVPNAPDGWTLERRRLAPSECDEIALAARRLQSPGLRTLAAMAWVVLVALAATTKPSGRSPWSDPFTAAVAIAIGLLAIARYARGVRLASAMRQDLADAVALTARAIESEGRAEEFLPHSRLLWRVNGAPAIWRDLRRRPLLP